MSKTLKLRLTLDVEYNPNGVPPVIFKDMLETLARKAASDGLMTGDTEATVKEWDATVVVVPETPENLAGWVNEAVEEGILTLDAERFVRVALTEPAQMLAELRERAEPYSTFCIEDALMTVDPEGLDTFSDLLRKELSFVAPKFLEGELSEREPGIARLIWEYKRFDLLPKVLGQAELDRLEGSPWIPLPNKDEEAVEPATA